MSDAIEARSRRMLKHITALQSIGLARAAAHHIATVHHAHRDAAAADAADALSAPKSSTSTSSSSSSPSVTAHPAQPVAQGAAAHRRPVAAAGSAVSSALTSLSESLTSLTSLTSIVRAIVQHGSTLSNAGASSSSGSSSALPSGLSSSLASGSSSELEAHHVEAASLKTLPSSPGSFAPSLWLQASSSSLPGPSSSLASASSTLPPSASSSSNSSPAGTATIPSPSDLDALGDSPQLQRLIEAVARLSAPNAGSAEDDQIASNASVQAVIELLTASIDANAPCLTQRVIGPMPLNQSHDDVQDMRLRITILLAAAKTCTLLWESIFKSALAFTLPLERHVDYWNDKQANPWFYYAQVLPATIFGFGRTLRRNWTFARIVHELLLSPFYKLHQHHAVIHQTKREHIVLLGRLSQWRRALKSSEWEVIMAPASPSPAGAASTSNSHTPLSKAAGSLDHETRSAPESSPHQRAFSQEQRALCTLLGRFCTDFAALLTDALTDGHTEQRQKAADMTYGDLVDAIINLPKLAEGYRARAHATLVTHGMPSVLLRYWIPTAVGTVAAFAGMRTWHARREDFFRWALEAKETAVRFATDWLWRPVQRIYETVRYDENQMALISTKSLQNDLDSLERMVQDFAADQLLIDQEALSRLGQNAREGDLSVVMREYENNIRTPYKSLVFGNLVRTALIQVQRTKVDLETAMTSIDKLMKSNELNFQVLTAVPTFALVRLGYIKIKNSLLRRAGLPRRFVNKEIRKHLRQVEIHLNRSNMPDGVIPFEDEGSIIVSLHLLHSWADEINSPEFAADLREIESFDEQQVGQRMAVVNRMYRTHAFLLPSSL